MTLKPWREVAVPHPDVLKARFVQADFAADINAARNPDAPAVYRDPVEFFERTYITEGMRLLLTQVAQRLAGRGGEPVVQLQTAFGGGKTHTMLAVHHLATRTVPLSDLQGIPGLVEQAGLMDVPQARVAVLDGNAHAPGQPWRHGKTTVRTLWGELAWQLGGAEAFERVKESDDRGTSPGKDVLRELLQAYAPCVVLVDELVAYIRQFPEGQSLPGGTFESNLSFVQALTEAVKQVPTAVVLASLPESDPKKGTTNVQVGGPRGLLVLRSLEDIFGRVHALWKPVAAEEGFEIVRRRLFEPIRDPRARDAVCRAFADTYTGEGARLPAETQESRYFDRLGRAYPIHPEVFDRLYEDWSTIEGFQRTRGVLKLMAKAIARLWKDQNLDLMILPGSLPLADVDVRNELTYYLPPGWDPVIDGDIDGDGAETTELEAKEPRFGQVNAARRVARTLFLGTAPSSGETKAMHRGLDRSRVLLGCVQPGQASAVYSDALNRLADRLHYLNASGEKTDENTRFWFDTRTNLRREMENRKRRFDDATDVRGRVEAAARKLFAGTAMFDSDHVFPPHADVPDDSALRLVVLPPDAWYSKDAPRQAHDAVLEYLRAHGTAPRHRANRLLFVAADQATLGRLKDAARTALAWASIVEDVNQGRLNIDGNQRRQAEAEARAASDVVNRAARECFRWLLCPVMDDPRAERPTIEAFPLNTTGGTSSAELERVCRENELVIETWAPIHLRNLLTQLYWKPDRPAVAASTFWEDSQKYLYLPRLKTRDVLAAALRAGASGPDFFGTAYGQTDGQYEGFRLGEGEVAFDGSLLLIEPEAARQYAATLAKALVVDPPVTGGKVTPDPPTGGDTPGSGGERKVLIVEPQKPREFIGSLAVPADTAKMKLVRLADEILSLLASDPNATVQVRVEIDAKFPAGVSDTIKRAVSENAAMLGFQTKEWE